MYQLYLYRVIGKTYTFIFTILGYFIFSIAWNSFNFSQMISNIVHNDNRIFFDIFHNLSQNSTNQHIIFLSLCPIHISPILFMYRYLIFFNCWRAILAVHDMLSHPNHHFTEKYIASVNSYCPSLEMNVRYPFSSADTSNSDRNTWFSLLIQVDCLPGPSLGDGAVDSNVMGINFHGRHTDTFSCASALTGNRYVPEFWYNSSTNFRNW